jgi:hypothetical protein
MSQQNVEVVREGWDAWIGGDPDGDETAQVATLRDGKVTRIDNYEDRAEALEAAGLRA